ncbi:hypothetical protein GFS31_35670 [Leptolyngbya sp. BL0902]|uniref:hypothetical protein n=1 Tax=Leptolyngbya sp. BL0902 TaxID=1115757 RepID=UPI0018E70B09|nr:hypothetical protein [Leptolyngbya sp. BL0902]QQE66863.1 hypothetical protein GFS31_35670 [Leptolyngbya sp. BL0902]
MTTDTPFPPSLLKDDLLRLVPIDLATADSLSPITEVWVDPRRHQVIGVGCGGGLGRRSQRFPWSQVVSIGHDGLVLRASEPPSSLSEENRLPEDSPFGEGIALSDVEVWSDYGDRLGTLTDYRLVPATGEIVQYHFTTPTTTASTAPSEDANSLPPGCYALPPQAVISLGRRRMMIAHEALAQAERLGDPAPPRPAGPRSALDALPLDQVFDHIPDPKQTWDATLDKTRQARTQFSEQWQEQGQRFQSEAQQRLGHWLGDVKKRTRRLRHQLRETVSDVTAGLPEPPQRRRPEPPPVIDVDATELWGDDEPPPPRR